jgi:hypothetical protein
MDLVVKMRMCEIKFTTNRVVNLKIGGKFINFVDTIVR